MQAFFRENLLKHGFLMQETSIQTWLLPVSATVTAG
jgi:CRISPR/Cas system-associated protein endoribonuclease Cas2